MAKKSTSDKIIEAIIGFDEWCMKNKMDFLKKNNPKLYKKLIEQK